MNIAALIRILKRVRRNTKQGRRKEFPKVKTFVGGAPVNGDFAQKIGVDYYTEEPQKLVEILNRLAAN